MALRQEGVALAELSRKFDGSVRSIQGALRRNGIHSRTGRPAWRTFSEQQVSDMVKMWEGGSSQRAIAVKYGTTQTLVSGVLKRSGFIPEARYSHARGAQHGSWRGGRVKIHGYWAVMLERGSPFMEMATTAQCYVLEHRLVMAQSLGRCLTSSETVHHINGDRTDNRRENLQLRQGRHGRGTAFQCLDCGSHNVGPVALEETLT